MVLFGHFPTKIKFQSLNHCKVLIKNFALYKEKLEFYIRSRTMIYKQIITKLNLHKLVFSHILYVSRHN